jgi:hypothetical protein
MEQQCWEAVFVFLIHIALAAWHDDMTLVVVIIIIIIIIIITICVV